LGNGENGPVETWEGIISQKKDVSSCAVVGVGFVEESSIRVGTKDHITRSVNNAICRISSNIV
jgi:hypothetical protein